MSSTVTAADASAQLETDPDRYVGGFVIAGQDEIRLSLTEASDIAIEACDGRGNELGPIVIRETNRDLFMGLLRDLIARDTEAEPAPTKHRTHRTAAERQRRRRARKRSHSNENAAVEATASETKLGADTRPEAIASPANRGRTLGT